MKKLSIETVNAADKVIPVGTSKDIPLSGLGFAIANADLKAHGFYGYTRTETNEKILLVVL